jgi:hypothetical protein
MKALKKAAKNSDVISLLNRVINIVEVLNSIFSGFDKGKAPLDLAKLTTTTVSFTALYLKDIKPLVKQFNSYYLEEEKKEKKKQKEAETKLLLDEAYYQIVMQLCILIEKFPSTLSQFAPFLDIEKIFQQLQKSSLLKTDLKRVADLMKLLLGRHHSQLTHFPALVHILFLFPELEAAFDEFEKNEVTAASITKVITKVVDMALSIIKKLPALLSLYEIHKKIIDCEKLKD